VEVSKYTLPEEITIKIKNVPNQNFSSINENDLIDFGYEKFWILIIR